MPSVLCLDPMMAGFLHHEEYLPEKKIDVTWPLEAVYLKNYSKHYFKDWRGRKLKISKTKIFIYKFTLMWNVQNVRKEQMTIDEHY